MIELWGNPNANVVAFKNFEKLEISVISYYFSFNYKLKMKEKQNCFVIRLSTVLKTDVIYVMLCREFLKVIKSVCNSFCISYTLI